MSDEDGMVRSISWPDLCPWTILFRLYRLSLSVQFLTLAFVGVLSVSLGWTLLGGVVLSDTAAADPTTRQFLQHVGRWSDPTWSFLPEVPEPERPASGMVDAEIVVDEIAAPADGNSPARSLLAIVWQSWLAPTPAYAIIEPMRRVVDPRNSWTQFLFYLFGSAWTLLVWSLIGGALTRAAAVRLGRDERVGLRDSLEFARRKILSFLGAPLLPLGAVLALGIPLWILGLLMRTNLGVVLGGLVWLPVGLSAFVMTIFAIGVLFGWPLMWSAISTEGSDAFDAISRSYAYTFQRPLHYFAYTLLASLLGLLGWIMVGLFCDAIFQFAMLGVGAGLGTQRMQELQNAVLSPSETTSGLVRFGVALIGFFNRCIYALRLAYSYSFLWSAAVAVYLLLRRDADQTELDDVFVEDDEGIAYGLPELSPDEQGVPGVESKSSASPDAVAGQDASPAPPTWTEPDESRSTPS